MGIANYFKNHPGQTAAASATAAFVVIGGLLTGWKSFDSVPNGYYGIRENLGQIDPVKLGPGWYSKKPWRESIWSFNNNVVRREVTVGSGSGVSSGSSTTNTSSVLADLITRDRNPFSVDMRIHYKISPDAGLLGLHLSDMSNSDGISLLKQLADNSTRYLAGQQNALDLLNDPENFLKSFVSDFDMRLRQNNVPVEIEMIELIALNVGGMRKITAMRWKSDGTIESSPAGSAAVPVPLAPSARPPAPAPSSPAPPK